MNSKFEKWLIKTYKPEVASWKRPALLFVSILICFVTVITAYTQIEYHWTNDGIWILVAVFSLFSILGLSVAIFCKDFWVALLLGKL